ncbi:MAG: polyribonucleotide nucleotidyltransferase [Oligoflexia bacterium]|nr:polyribonucleotide nucleotidyltransferase [Oligoflexia bacterium]
MVQSHNWNVVRETFKIGDKEITIETGRLAKQADGAVLVSCNDTRMLVTAVSKREPDQNKDFFPLTIEYQEKYYASGKIPGGFFKREAKPTTDATLTARLIDRPLRPVFPSGYLNDTQVVATVLSVDGTIEPGILGGIGASAALSISDIPFNGPVASCQVALVGGRWVACPTLAEVEEADLEMVVAGTRAALLMVEGGAKFVSEAQMLEALKFGHAAFQPAIEAQERLRKKVGKEKRAFNPPEMDQAFRTQVEQFLTPKIASALKTADKQERYAAFDQAKQEAAEKFLAGLSDDLLDKRKKELGVIIEDVKYAGARNMILKDKIRIDGRSTVDIRPISVEVGLLPRAHGSGLFTRGETQVLGATTLGTSDDEQLIDSITGNYYRQFMLHYNFPPYSVGEVGRFGGQGRREIGHGALAERAIKAIIPDNKEFPYTIRVVGEVLESNGSSSMGTVCAGTLSLLDAGVPVKEPVAGIAMGLIKEGDNIAILSDILGDEDHLGDMDFKVAGGESGITAFQMDIKIEGVTFDIMERALAQAAQGRAHILSQMTKLINKPRAEMSQYAPRIETIQVKAEKVREIIGPGGKVIKGIIEATGVKIDIEDDGKVNIFSSDPAATAKAREMIMNICAEAEVGKIYRGKVKKIVDFGAFIEIIPGTDGLLHISEIAHERIRTVTDVLKEGDEVEVKVLDIDRAGKIKLSRKVLIEKTV